MTSTQPAFCLHNGQIVLMDGDQTSPSNWKDILGDDDDARSSTSSNMSEEDSWTDDSSFDDDDDDDDNESDCDENNTSMMIMDTSCMDNSSRNYSQSCTIKPNRSTASLMADFAMPEPKIQKQQLQTPFQMAAMAKARSMLDLSSADNEVKKQKPLRMNAIQRVSAQDCASGTEVANVTKPDDHLSNLLETQLDRVPYASLGDYFLKATPEHIAAWDHDLLRAIRTHDLPLIKKMHQEGKPLQASNQFGESTMHVCVRRGTSEILKYLLDQGVSPRVHCDYGRTPLHDALWTISNPESLRMAAMIIAKCPEMLLVTDKRGFTPLNYVPRDLWGNCCQFLDRCTPLLLRLKNNGRQKAVGVPTA